MMRSMYSAVSGLKTHQTKMDVIGNNIANVNTVAFKSSSVTFQDMLYQNISGASGANATTGTGGINAKQIGLGVTTGATNISIESAGAAETTGRAFDLRITDSSTTNFFVVNNGSKNLFTRSGSFYVDGSGNLCMTSTGYTVMGWQVDPTTGNIRKDTVSALQIMKTENLTSNAEATTNATCGGIIDKNDPDVLSDDGLIKNLNFYDSLGYSYTARFAIRQTGGENSGRFSIELESILNSDGETIFPTDATTDAQRAQVFGNLNTAATLGTYDEVKKGFYKDPADGRIYVGSDNTGTEITFNGTDFDDGNGTNYSLKQVYGISDGMVEKITAGATPTVTNGVLTVTGSFVGYDLSFSTADGTFDNINGQGSVSLNLQNANFANNGVNFSNISIDFTTTKNSNNGGKSTVGIDSGALDGTTGKGKKLGNMIGLSVNTDGEIYGTYDNGNRTLLGQIAVAQFANAAGLEKVGENCYDTTLNSGEFDGIGVAISADGSKMTSGELEMSNVDLSTEFTQMITTQRGFQANSRVITTSDTLLEELVNLKR
ncbi:MAG: flagellar hook-basal body complex protein [Roseburia sp.]|nr:flagellar hook-basal body complex protein [Roseburia sp.]